MYLFIRAVIYARYPVQVHIIVLRLKRFGRLSRWNHDAQTSAPRVERVNGPEAELMFRGASTLTCRPMEAETQADLYRNLRFGENINFPPENRSA